MTGLNEAQLAYLRDVLGIGSVVLPTRIEVAQSESPAPQTSDLTQEQGAALEGEARIHGDLASAALVCVFSGRENYVVEGEAATLADKMIQAMKLQDADVVWVEWKGATAPRAVRELVLSAGFRPVLCFGLETLEAIIAAPAALGRWSEWQGVRLIATHSLGELLAKPALKKPAWAHLQSVIKAIE